MKQEVMRQQLMQSTMHIVAQYGIHRTTTKAISIDAGLNEAYIYRLFADKEDLFQKTFCSLDEEVATMLLQNFPIMKAKETTVEERCWQLFSASWQYLLKDKEKWSFYIKYYHSQFFDSYSIEMRKQIFRPVLEWLTPAFKAGTDVWSLFNHIMDVVFSGLLKVLRDETLETEETAAGIYDLIYYSLHPYLAWTEPCEGLRRTGI